MTALRGPRSWRSPAASSLGDGAVVAVAGAAVLGAVVPLAVPVWLGVAAVAGVLLRPRPVLVAGAVALLAGGLAVEARAGLAPLPAGPYEGVATLVGDPQPAFGGWRVDVRTDRGRLELHARGGAGGRLRSRAAGERVRVSGRIDELADPERAVPRHVRGRLLADVVVPVDDGGPLVALVNGLRGAVVRGAASLPEQHRALFTGFVLGDDRGASVAVADDFEGAGLSHLLVVSGQNVAFVLAVASPALARLGHRGRFVATLALLGLFAGVTRFEPSVLRATAMAGVGALAVASGRPARGVRVLALAVTGLVLVDPLLVHSLGFRLSVAASAGIVVLAGPLARALPLPPAVALPLAVTLSAQAAVAPLLVPVFGPLPVAAVPANLLAEPVAGLVMMWGCTAGLVAGVVPEPVAALVHRPTAVGLWWVAGVARTAAAAPLGALGLGAASAVAAALAVMVLAARRHRPRSAVAASLVALALLASPAVAGPPAHPPGEVAVGGAQLWRGAGAEAASLLVVPGDADVATVLSGLRRRGVRHLDLVVLRSPGPRAAGLLHVLRQRVRVDEVWAPGGSPAPGALPAPRGPVEAGGLRLEVTPDGERLAVEVALAGRPAGGRGAVTGGG